MEIKDLFGLTGKNVAITGSASGMSRAATEMLISLGAKCDKKSLNVMLYHEKKGVREGADPHPSEVTLPMRA